MYKDLNGVFGTISTEAVERASKYLVFTGNDIVDYNSIIELQLLKSVVDQGISNDITKYNIPECYRVTEQLTINARSLQNFLSLRSDKSALWEIRQLAHSLYNALPEEHKYLFIDHIKPE